MEPTDIGERDLLVLAAVLRLGDEAYGVNVLREIESRAGRRISLGTAYAALGRLADAGLVTFRMSDPLPVRGGRARRHARITPLGRRVLSDAARTFARMFDGLDLGWSSAGRR